MDRIFFLLVFDPDEMLSIPNMVAASGQEETSKFNQCSLLQFLFIYRFAVLSFTENKKKINDDHNYVNHVSIIVITSFFFLFIQLDLFSSPCRFLVLLRGEKDKRSLCAFA